jgi:hypothetical protein
MATNNYAIYSNSVSNLDTLTPNPNTVGEGASGWVKNLTDTLTPTTAVLGSTSTTATMNFLRVHSKAIVKRLKLITDGNLDTSSTTVGSFNVGVAYSDAANPQNPGTAGFPTGAYNDGTNPSSAAVVVSSTFFLSAGKFGGGSNTNSLGNNYDVPIKAANINLPLWKALGLAADPGGFFDIFLQVAATATTTGTAVVAMSLDYIV